MPYRIAIGSCSHPSLPQPLWPVLRSRRPSAFVWGGDAIYADRFAGMNWTAVGVSWSDDGDEDEEEKKEKKKGSWKVTFPPPSIHVDATPEIIREWYRKQWEVASYREFANGWERSNAEGAEGGRVVDRPIVFGTIDDHDYGSNNGDATFRFRRESNLEFLEFLYFGVPGSDENESRDEDVVVDNTDSASGGDGVCRAAESDAGDDRDAMADGNDGGARERNTNHRDRRARGRNKLEDPMYQRAVEGKGVYGVQLFDFSRKFDDSIDGNSNDDGILWGGGHWVPEEEALVDDDVVARVAARHGNNNRSAMPNYSTTRSVAVFVLDVRSNKTPWPTKGGNHARRTNRPPPQSSAPRTPPLPPPPRDFLGQHQWNWLRSSLRRSRAPLNIVLTGLQVHPHRFPDDGNIVEEWSKFPAAQTLFYDVLLNSLDDDYDHDDDGYDNGEKEKARRGSILLVSGDVHMAQFLRKDCVRARTVREALDSSHRRTESASPPPIRPLVEVTASGMTHSWGTSFSSQPRLHRWPRKPYAYFVSRAFMTLCHCVNPWREVMVRTVEDAEREETERRRDGCRRGYDNGYGDDDGATASTGKMGLQYELGLNFAEFEFEFWDGRHDAGDDGAGDDGDEESGGAVTVRIFGKDGAQSPKLQSRWTFDQLSGDAPLPGMTAKFPEDFASMLSQKTYRERNDDEEWICIPHRGNASVVREYVANVIMFLVFCFLFFLPYLLMGVLFVRVRRRYGNKRSSC
mmetsp:Transcript_24599/g.49015  ORF Transcript_24599/g.49015 Transcript_24599/m.49015 type:complete len:743 (+) Transcript_24599:280-2508(+)